LTRIHKCDISLRFDVDLNSISKLPSFYLLPSPHRSFLTQIMSDNCLSIDLPSLPTDHVNWISYVASHPDKPLHELIAPYKAYDSKLREVFAQQPDHPAIGKPNVVPIFAGNEEKLRIRARDLANESKTERECYLMPLKKAHRKPNNAPAVVQSLKEFQTNFQLFSESSLVDMDWSNVVVAGSAVVTSLLPVPDKYNTSKRALREYYHQKLAPASDVDLFLYDLTEEQAIEKIKQIEQRIKDSILTETTTVRTKNAITIVSQYPTRHVQIVLRIYLSISEILTGFDVDCSCAAYDGSQVYASPRALAAYMTQINTIDLTRRSPSYESRLSKYSRRGFEVHWSLLDRSRIDPTLFERSFGRTLGLARLLVLEKLPNSADREAYVDQRRAERGRPAINRGYAHELRGNIKDNHDDEIAEWVETDEVSDYHTFTIPYGPKYHARGIDRLLYAKDLLLNAEWNRPKERDTILHRHPAFFGNAIDVIADCCGYCPEPITPEDKDVAEEENKIYVSGTLSFIKDNPGRQAIGSFRPLTDDDWTEMAYVGNTARLCQAIVEGDLEHVQDWLNQEGADPNRRDYTGRTPLHLAVMSSTPEVIQSLIDAGARIVARLVDGKTALHLAAMRGESSIVKALLIKSESNEEKEAEKVASKRRAQNSASESDRVPIKTTEAAANGTIHDSEQEFDESASVDMEHDEDDDIDMLDDSSENADATTEHSIIKIDRKSSTAAHENLPDDADEDEPDVYDVNVLSWDVAVSPLHLAIAHGHTDVVKALVQDFGADLLLPVKLLDDYSKAPRAAILPIVLALQLPAQRAQEMTKLLINLGASAAQADVEHVTALHYFTAHSVGLLNTMITANQPAAQRAVNHIAVSGSQYSSNGTSVLQTAIEHRDIAAVEALLELGAKPEIDFGTYMTSCKDRWNVTGSTEDNQKRFRQDFKQPVFTAVDSEMTSIVLRLLDAGAGVDSLTPDAWKASNQQNMYSNSSIHSLLDAVRHRSENMRTFLATGETPGGNSYYYGSRAKRFHPIALQNDAEYLQGHQPRSYGHWSLLEQIKDAKNSYEEDLKLYKEYVEPKDDPKGTKEKKATVQARLLEFETLESQLLNRGAKTFKELYPDVKIPEEQPYHGYNYEPEQPKPFQPLLSFRLPDMTDERRQAYVELFEACWNGDLPTIKKLTLAVWGDNQSPLKIAVQDKHDFSPFSIAVLRNHLDVAKAVLEIAHAQYAPKEQVGQAKHSIRQKHENDDSTDDENDEVHIFSEIVDDRFTVENIGEVQHQVKSDITPSKMLSWTCPCSILLQDGYSTASTTDQGYTRRRSTGGRPPRKVSKDAAKNSSDHASSQHNLEKIPDQERPLGLFQFAIYLNDAHLMGFLIDMAEDLQTRNTGSTETAFAGLFRFDESDFLYAIRLGRVEMLGTIIKRTGAGFPLDDLVKQSGIEIPEKPKHYQGLSVHGKKRTDWANEGRESQGGPAEADHPPLLHAAQLGSLESIEWLSSDAILRCYTEFVDKHKGDVRIQNLSTLKGGIEASISKWLRLRSHLLIHCVVLNKTDNNSLHLLRQLCKTHPEALQHRSSNGMTPLQLAFRLHRVAMIKVLLEAGVDQTCRDNDGANIVHSILSRNFVRLDLGDLDRIRELLGLVDPRLLPSLFLERTTEGPGAATPLAYWMHQCVEGSDGNDKDLEKFVRLILEFSKGEDLGIVNGEGDTPLHAAVRYGADAISGCMLEHRPELLFRENATGRIPYEMAEDAYLSKEVFNNPPSLQLEASTQYRYGHGLRRAMRSKDRQNVTDVLARQPQTFVEEPQDPRSTAEKVWETCKEFADKAQGAKRKLVSLVEASEVAKRLALRQSGHDEVEEQVGEVKNTNYYTGYDEVDAWFHAGLCADRK
jgi:ankyrin repeat protein